MMRRWRYESSRFVELSDCIPSSNIVKFKMAGFYDMVEKFGA